MCLQIPFLRVNPWRDELSITNALSELSVQKLWVGNYTSELYLRRTRVRQGLSSYHSKKLFEERVLLPNRLHNSLNIPGVLDKVRHFPVLKILLGTLVQQVWGLLLPTLEYIWVPLNFRLIVLLQDRESDFFSSEVGNRLVEIKLVRVLNHEVLPAWANKIGTDVDHLGVDVFKVRYAGEVRVSVRD